MWQQDTKYYTKLNIYFLQCENTRECTKCPVHCMKSKLSKKFRDVTKTTTITTVKCTTLNWNCSYFAQTTIMHKRRVRNIQTRIKIAIKSKQKKCWCYGKHVNKIWTLCYIDSLWWMIISFLKRNVISVSVRQNRDTSVQMKFLKGNGLDNYSWHRLCL